VCLRLASNNWNFRLFYLFLERTSILAWHVVIVNTKSRWHLVFKVHDVMFLYLRISRFILLYQNNLSWGRGVNWCNSLSSRTLSFLLNIPGRNRLFAIVSHIELFRLALNQVLDPWGEPFASIQLIWTNNRWITFNFVDTPNSNLLIEAALLMGDVEWRHCFVWELILLRFNFIGQENNWVGVYVQIIFLSHLFSDV